MALMKLNYHGVSLRTDTKTPKWRFVLMIRKKQVAGGSYDHPKKAAQAYDDAMIKHGIFNRSRFNFPTLYDFKSLRAAHKLKMLSKGSEEAEVEAEESGESDEEEENDETGQKEKSENGEEEVAEDVEEEAVDVDAMGEGEDDENEDDEDEMEEGDEDDDEE